MFRYYELSKNNFEISSWLRLPSTEDSHVLLAKGTGWSLVGRNRLMIAILERGHVENSHFQGKKLETGTKEMEVS